MGLVGAALPHQEHGAPVGHDGLHADDWVRTKKDKQEGGRKFNLEYKDVLYVTKD